MTSAAAFDAKAKLESERACAAAELTGYVGSMLALGDVPACHAERLTSLIARLSTVHSIPAASTIGALR